MRTDDYDRQQAYLEQHGKYRRFSHDGTCFYCGDVDTTDDHVPPLSILYRLRGHDQNLNPLLVRSCARCNSSLGDIALMTPIERRDYIQRTAMPRMIENLRMEIQELRQRYDASLSMLNHIQSLHESKIGSAANIVTFEHIPVGFTFQFSDMDGDWKKTSELTYKGNRGSFVADLKAIIKAWTPPPIAEI